MGRLDRRCLLLDRLGRRIGSTPLDSIPTDRDVHLVVGGRARAIAGQCTAVGRF